MQETQVREKVGQAGQGKSIAKVLASLHMRVEGHGGKQDRKNISQVGRYIGGKKMEWFLTGARRGGAYVRNFRRCASLHVAYTAHIPMRSKLLLPTRSRRLGFRGIPTAACRRAPLERGTTTAATPPNIFRYRLSCWRNDGSTERGQSQQPPAKPTH